MIVLFYLLIIHAFILYFAGLSTRLRVLFIEAYLYFRT